MPISTNLGNWLIGSPKSREQAANREAWDDVERLWRSCPLGRSDLSDFVLAIVQEALEAAERRPATPILVSICEAFEALLVAEHIGEVEVVWPIIDAEVAEAANLRELIRHRRMWAADFLRVFGVVRGQMLQMCAHLFEALPEGAYGDWEESDRETFDVPLCELVDDTGELAEHLMLTTYTDETLRLGLFKSVREIYVGNVLVASGFDRSDNAHERASRLVMPSRYQAKSPAELVERYLAGTPFLSLFEIAIPLHIPMELRFEHTHIVGGTGHGKTQLMQRMIYADLAAAQTERRSVVVIDSQGDLIGKLMRLELFDPGYPDGLADRLIVVDPYDIEFPAALNLFDAQLDRLAGYRLVDRERVLNGVVELYETFFGDLLGAELTQKQGVIFKYLARLMLTIPGATIHTLMQLMEDGRSFKPYMEKLEGSSRYFFETEFFHPSFAATKKQILRRLWGVLSTPAFERMFAQPQNKLDLFQAMNEGKIILINTAKDLLKDEGSRLLGRFFIAMLSQAALERATVPEDERTPTFVYIDEAQEYFDERIETILNQARKYKVGMVLAHQMLDQLTPRLRAALHANTSFKCVGGVSARDARALADELHTDAEFIERMRRRGQRSEFAVWLKHLTPSAIRLSVPLGFLERQPTMDEGSFDQLLDRNRARYCGTLDSVSTFWSLRLSDPQQPEAASPPQEPRRVKQAIVEPVGEGRGASTARPPTSPQTPTHDGEAGKGGQTHRYLQSLVKGLAEAQGFKATIEAPLPDGSGQVDVLLTRDVLQVAVEVSVTTRVEWEIENIKKCLRAGYARVAIVLAKSAKTQGRYRQAAIAAFGDEPRLVLLAPEEVPDFIASLAPASGPTETVVRGYKVRVAQNQVSPGEAKARRDALTRVIAKSLQSRDRN